MARAGAARRDRRGRIGYAASGSTASEPLIERLNAWGEDQFRSHGRRISRHQISTLLICSLVITSLFYPAVGIYFWASKGGPGVSRGDAASVWRSLSTPFMDSFSSSGRRHINSLSDLRMIWDDARDLNALDIHDAERMYGPQLGQPPSGQRDGASEGEPPRRPHCRTVRVEHVFVTTDDIMAGRGPKYGSLERPILQSALKLQTAIQAEILPQQDGGSALGQAYTSGRLACVQPIPKLPGHEGRLADADGPPSCLALSPLEYWQMSEAAIQQDEEPALTAARSTRNVTLQGVPLSVPTTLAGRWHLFKKMPRAEYLALTFFLEDLRDDNCAAAARRGDDAAARRHATVSRSHAAWHKLLTRVTSGQVKLVPSEQDVSHELLLEFAPREKSLAWRTGHVILLVGYAIVLVYIAQGLVKMRKVHSRFGLAFSGLTELIIGMVMSVSICALLGIRLTLVPWELLPFVVVVVGSENMFVLTSAIVNTPLSLTVPARIAHGLSKAGGPIAMTTVADMALLSFIALSIGVRAVKEFCIFAILSLVMDFFLQMTFFVTILSIDMQRLELADLLTQGARSSQALRKKEIAQLREGEPGSPGHRAKASDGFIKASFKAVWKARTARTASLTLILGFLGGLYLYYGTGYPAQQAQQYVLDVPRTSQAPGAIAAAGGTAAAPPVSTGAFDPYAHLDPALSQMPWWTSSPSANLWLSLNPQGASELRIVVEPWTILSLRSGTADPQGPMAGQTFAGWALFRPRVRAIIWFSKLVILPISGTTVLLWMLLLYLLKDTELLDAQRDKSEAEDESTNALGKPEDDGDDLDDGLPIDVTAFTGLHAADVEFLAESQGVAVSMDTESYLRVWKAPIGGLDDRDQLGTPALGEGARLAAIRANREADASPVTALAVSATAGLAVIGLASGRVCFVSLATLKLFFEGKHAAEDSCAVQHISLRHRTALNDVESLAAITVHRDGSAYEWSPAKATAVQISGPRPEATWTAFDVTYAAAADPLPPALGPFAPSSSLPTIAFASSDRRFEIKRQAAVGPDLETIFEISSGERAYFRSAVICPQARRSPTAFSVEDDDEGSILVTGQTDGVVRAWELKGGRLLSTLDLGDGAISCVRAVVDDDQSSCTLVVSTSSRVSLLGLGSDPFGQFGLEPSLSLPGSLNGFAGGSPVKNRTPNGSTHLSAPTFWGDNSAPTTPTSEMPNPLAYPISSHGNAARLRRASGHGRDRSGVGSESSNASGLASTLPSSSSSAEANGPEDRQLRLIGCIPCLRGGCELIVESRCLIGVRRRNRPVSLPDSLLRRRRMEASSTALGSSGGDGASPRWELWTLDLRSDLDIGRNGEIVAPRRTLRLDGDGVAPPQDGRHAASRQSIDAGATTSRVRFSHDGPGPEAALRDLAFTRLSPVVGAFSGTTATSALLFGYGGSVGCIAGRLGTLAHAAAAATSELDAARYAASGQRRSKSSGGSIVGANGGAVSGNSLLRR
ncbi:uncharacterized protein PFL1_02016 [Pseudozyma flocculosa PF-1]|uniref:Sterol regulatory element-binding protein cleavage-activating protein n=1 Tax=Pseudozyma flocculosa TaxID=84751 RepID=A0A5C3EZ69_9BASI|nr:uncharacterized protein PFL1_02016 [Pseudozyma flocculosa PF-1]EPQ30490.1 hypothetical protein PFL1_02016 [Pseudozyma flocculosa PF-1]SPO37574.1 related to Sterol regulatory element binding protein cleavage-activating protein [Pseudozyma flocculosa]